MLFLTIGLYEALTLFFRDPLNIRTESLLIAAVMLCLSLLFPLYYRLPRNCALAVTTFIMMMIVSVTFGFAMALTKYGKTIPPEFEIIWRFPFFPPAMAAIASASYIGSLFVSLRIMARKVL